MKVAAIVVTYNRKGFLKHCLECLQKQTVNESDTIVIDNASTDGTGEMMKDLTDDHTIYINTGHNLGGAGGFQYGIKYAIKHGYEYLWLLDDDVYVQKNALEELLNADNFLEGNYGFLSSVALWTDGSACTMNRPKLANPWYKYLAFLKEGLLPVKMATFVSFFIKADVVRNIGLPIKEFFIWGDDIEYSQRISDKYSCFLVGKSQIIHQTENNAGSNIAQDDSGRMTRYKYAYRNEVYIARKNGISGMLGQCAKIMYHCIRVIISDKPQKLKKIDIILGNSFKGLFFNPKIEYIK